MRTQVAVVGAGPAGLLLSHLLRLEGVESVVLEARSRDYVEQRVRAGVLEQGTVDLLVASDLGERLQREGLRHTGIELRFDGRGHRIDFAALTGKAITVYGQQEVVKDLIDSALRAGGEILFDVADVTVHDIDSQRPRVRFRRNRASEELHCDAIAGTDGFHGVCRPSIPPGALATFERTYPFAWLGILAAAAPSHDELIYAYHERGFALFSMRSPEVTRLYLQVAPDENIDQWPDARVWRELHTRLETDDGWTLNEGPVLEKGITPMRSYVVEPMQYGRLFLAGDAAHIVPPTGAKGMNLAVADVSILARGLIAFFKTGREDLLRQYSATCLARVWRAEHFSWWMTSMLHRFPDGDTFTPKLQHAQLAYLATSRAAATSLAENYVGLPLP
jgi:p-hydroxybenzoate 3-monooxygenase